MVEWETMTKVSVSRTSWPIVQSMLKVGSHSHKSCVVCIIAREHVLMKQEPFSFVATHGFCLLQPLVSHK